MFQKSTDLRCRNWYVITIDNRRYTLVVNPKTKTVSNPRYRQTSKPMFSGVQFARVTRIIPAFLVQTKEGK